MHLTKNKTERCVMARIQRRGKRYQANFTLREYGGWKAARIAAEKWVNHLAMNLPPRLSSKGVLSVRNTSGVVGVFPHRQSHRKLNGRKSYYYNWVARWPGCTYRGGVRWSVNRFGNDDAFVLAVLCRRMETVVRAQVLDELAEIKATPEYAQLLKLRNDR